MSRNNKLSSINSKNSLDVVQLPFPIPSSKIQNPSSGVLNPNSVSQASLSVEGLRSFSGERRSVGLALEQGHGAAPAPLGQEPLFQQRAVGILYSASKTEKLSLLKKGKVLKTLPFFNRSFDKKRLKLLFSWYYANKGENAAFSLVETLQKLGFTYAMKAGISLGVDDLKVPSTKIDSLTEAVFALNNTKASVESGNVTALEEFQQFVDTWHRTSENLKTSVIQNFTRGLTNKKSLPNSLKQLKLKKPKITSFPSSSFQLPLWDSASSVKDSKDLQKLDPSDYHSLQQTNQRLSIRRDRGKNQKQDQPKLEELQNTKAFYQKVKGSSFGKQNLTEGMREGKVFRLEDSINLSVQNFSDYKPLLRSYGNNLNPVYMMAFSGARGNLSQVRQLVGMRGLMADPQGQLVEFPIQSNFREGLTVTEYMISCYGARKGLVDTALRTAAAGYLTRRLVDVSHHQIVRSVTCGTKSGIYVPKEVNKESKEKSLKSNRTTKTKERKSVAFYIGRVLARDIPGVAFRNQEIDTALGSSRHFRDVYENLGIYIRSPLTCKSEIGICQLCYGWSVSANRLVGLGEAVGIIAAQSIGEPGTQLTMRTFHTGGVFSGDIMEECRVKHEGIVCFQGASLGLMVRTAGGAIAFCLKTKAILQIKGLEKLTTYTFLPNTLLFVRQGEKVGVETLLAQIPNLPEIEESTGESTKTIVSNLSGEVRQTPTVNKELENIRILAGQENVPFFCSKEFLENQVAQAVIYKPQRQSKYAKLAPQYLFKLTGGGFQKDNGLPLNGAQQSKVKLGTKWHPSMGIAQEKQKVHLIRGSHRIGNHTRTYRKNNFLTENYKFITYKQKSLPFLDNFEKAKKGLFQKAKGHRLVLTQSKVLPRLLDSTSRVLFPTNLPDGKSFWSDSFGYSQSINRYFLSKIILLTKNSSKTGVLLQLRSLKVLKKQKKRFSLPQSTLWGQPFAKSLDLGRRRTNAQSTSSKNLPRFEVLVDQNNLNVLSIIKNLPKPLLNKITFLQNKTINFANFASNGLCRAPLGHEARPLPKGHDPKGHGQGEYSFTKAVNPRVNGEKYVFARQVKKSKQSRDFLDFTPKQVLANSQKINTFFLYKQFFFHQYNTPLLLYKCKNTLDFVVQKTLRQGLVLKTAAIQKAQFNQKTKLKAFNPYVGIILRSFNSTKNNRVKKGSKGYSLEHQKDLSFSLWWPLNLQDSSIKKQKVKFYTFKILKTISITKSLKFSKYSFLFWKLSFVIFVKSLQVKKKKSFFLNKRFIKSLQWWGSKAWTSKATKEQTTFSSLGAKLNKKILKSSVLPLPKALLAKRESIKEDFWTNSLIEEISANHYYQQAKEGLEHQQKANRLDLLTSQKTGEIFPIQGNISINSFQKSYRFWLKPENLGQRGFKDTNRESRSSFVPWLLPTRRFIKIKNLILTDSDRVSYNLINKNLENTNPFKDFNLTLFKKPLEQDRFYQAQSLLELPPNSFSKKQTKNFKPQIGYFINIGDELIKNYGSAHCGQIIEKSYSQLTLRFNQNVLYSNLQNRPAVVSKHVKDGSWLPSGTSLVTLPYISSVTGDIVAGIPKIEQLFEARGEALEKTVDKMWFSYKTAVVPRAKAVRECFKEIGLFVVAAIQKVYSSQGVQIADKHLEVIIRQMIGRGLILDPGDTPFLPDEFVDLQTIERVNWTTYGERASYRPHLVGITKASLTSNSFLSSASFQQTARVLERETFLEKTDRLLGLKERVMMGALINAGTGDFQTGVGLSKVSKTFLRKN